MGQRLKHGTIEEKYFEDVTIKPLLQNAVVANQWNQYRTNRIFCGDKHTYQFVGEVKSFYMKPTEVIRHIAQGNIVVQNNGTKHLWN